MSCKFGARKTPYFFGLKVGDFILAKHEVPDDSWDGAMRNTKRRRQLRDVKYKIITVLPYIIVCEDEDGETATFGRSDYADGTITRLEDRYD